MWKLLQIELYKIFRRPRTYISFAAITALIGVIQLGLKMDGEAYVDFLMSSLKDNFELDGKENNDAHCGYNRADRILCKKR